MFQKIFLACRMGLWKLFMSFEPIGILWYYKWLSIWRRKCRHFLFGLFSYVNSKFLFIYYVIRVQGWGEGQGLPRATLDGGAGGPPMAPPTYGGAAPRWGGRTFFKYWWPFLATYSDCCTTGLSLEPSGWGPSGPPWAPQHMRGSAL